MKKIVLIASLFACAQIWGETTLTGTVKTESKNGIADVVVSDGYSVVKTDANGAYSMPYNPSAAFVFVSLPSGYDMPDANGLPKIWQTIDKQSATHTHDFILHQQEDGGKADSCHVLLVIGDPQALDMYGVWRFRHETKEDMEQLIATYPAGTKFLGVTVGDVTWDRYEYNADMKKVYEDMPFPNFIAIGNHDHNSQAPQQAETAQQDSVASLLFESYFGPTYYSFNKGAVHYVVMDNVIYQGYAGGDKSYSGRLNDKQKNWVAKDIAQLKEGTQVVFAMHIKTISYTPDMNYLKGLVAPLKSTCHVMSGHVHTNENFIPAATFMEHNVAACQGSFWCCDWCGDGSPNGYKVFETSPKGMVNYYYKGTGLDKDYRVSTFPTKSINAGNNKQTSIIANVWEYDKNCTLKIREDGVEYAMNTFRDGTDPDVFDIMYLEGDARPNYPGSEGGTAAGKNPGSKTTSHLFTYIPKSEDSKLEIVFTDAFGHTTIAPVLRHMMVASFNEDTALGTWQYTQDFNWLPAYPNYVTGADQRGTWIAGHTPKGWYGATSKTESPSAGNVQWAGFNYLQINGDTPKAWLHSFGNQGATTEDNSRERALGSLNSSSHKRISYGVIIENNTGSAISSLDITYTGEVWRAGADNTAKEGLKVSYAILTDEQARQIRDREAWIGQISSTDVPELKFTTPDNITAKTAGQTNLNIDGNNPNNRKEVNGKIELALPAGQVVLIRWDDDLATSDDTDQAFAIDDVKIVPTLSTGLPEAITSLRKQTQLRPMVLDGHVFIQTPQNTYTISGQRK